MRRALLPTLLACSLAGVAALPARAQPDNAAEGPALAEFEQLVQRCQAAYEARPLSEVAYAPAAGAWVKRLYAPTEILARTQRTPSTVSPYVGQITITETASAQRGDDFDTVRAMNVPVDENVLRAVRRVNLAYQNHAWTVIGGIATLEVKRDAGDSFSPVQSRTLGREALLQLEGPVASCIAPGSY